MIGVGLSIAAVAAETAARWYRAADHLLDCATPALAAGLAAGAVKILLLVE